MSRRFEATMAASGTKPCRRRGLREALIGACKAAILTLGLAFPILAYRADVNFSNELILQSRWFAVLVAGAAVFVLRFISLTLPRRTQALKRKSLVQSIPVLGRLS